MYPGRIVELADKHRSLPGAASPYTRMLLAAMPGGDPQKNGERRFAERRPKPGAGCSFKTAAFIKLPFAMRRFLN